MSSADILKPVKCCQKPLTFTPTHTGHHFRLSMAWQVADASTCYLMENFYWHYVKNRQTKTRSLQLAMQAVKAKKEHAHPYFWAPFVVMGDWR